MADDKLGQGQRFACLDPLVPGVAKFCVTSTSADPEPRPAVTATTAFAGVLHGAAFVTRRTDHGRRRGCWCLYVNIRQRKEQENAYQSLFSHAVTCYWPS